MSEPESDEPRHRLDPDRAAPRNRLDPDSAAPRHRLDPDRAARSAAPPDRPPTPVIDTRRYRLAIGGFAAVLLIAFSVWLFTSHHARKPTGAVGHRLQFFAAPLAASTLNGDANTKPPCTPGRHDPRALNVCLLVQRSPLVLAFFVTSSGACERQVDTLQALSGEFAPGQVQFAAVAVGDSHSAARAAVRAHHWTIPVAYDADGAVGQLYDVQVCPLLELARRGGIVTDVLIGKHWVARSALAPRVRALLAG